VRHAALALVLAGCVDGPTVDSCDALVTRGSTEAHVEVRVACTGLVDVQVSTERGPQWLWANEPCPVHFRVDATDVPDWVQQFTVTVQPDDVACTLR
jgi:hypothetical protein